MLRFATSAKLSTCLWRCSRCAASVASMRCPASVSSATAARSTLVDQCDNDSADNSHGGATYRREGGYGGDLARCVRVHAFKPLHHS
jgi:hypothetical protein